jgi:hypothetical protein
MMAAFAELSRDVVHERTMAGLDAAGSQGRVGRRPSLMDRQTRHREGAPSRWPEQRAWRSIKLVKARIWAFEGKEALSKPMALLHFAAVLLDLRAERPIWESARQGA